MKVMTPIAVCILHMESVLFQVNVVHWENLAHLGTKTKPFGVISRPAQIRVNSPNTHPQARCALVAALVQRLGRLIIREGRVAGRALAFGHGAVALVPDDELAQAPGESSFASTVALSAGSLVIAVAVVPAGKDHVAGDAARDAVGAVLELAWGGGQEHAVAVRRVDRELQRVVAEDPERAGDRRSFGARAKREREREREISERERLAGTPALVVGEVPAGRQLVAHVAAVLDGGGVADPERRCDRGGGVEAQPGLSSGGKRRRCHLDHADNPATSPTRHGACTAVFPGPRGKGTRHAKLGYSPVCYSRRSRPERCRRMAL